FGEGAVALLAGGDQLQSFRRERIQYSIADGAVGDVVRSIGMVVGAARVRPTNRDLRGAFCLHLRGGVLVYTRADSGGAVERADCGGALFFSDSAGAERRSLAMVR